MTTPAPVTITVTIDNPDALGAGLKALVDALGALFAGAAVQGLAPVAAPAAEHPARVETQLDPVADPLRDVLAALKSDPATHDVAVHLIAPLVERGLAVSAAGNYEVLRRTAAEFRVVAPRKLQAAARYLAGGKHKLFPDVDEIDAALSRTDRRSAAGLGLDEPTGSAGTQGPLNGVHA